MKRRRDERRHPEEELPNGGKRKQERKVNGAGPNELEGVAGEKKGQKRRESVGGSKGDARRRGQDKAGHRKKGKRENEGRKI